MRLGGRSPETLTALRLAREAALVIRTTARPRRILRSKSSAFDLLTATDVKVERLVRRGLAKAYPDHVIIGEEAGNDQSFDIRQPTWFVDPVDGTTNYFMGLPLVACNIAFCDEGELLTGVTADVSRLRTYWAQRGGGAWLGRTRLRVSPTRTLGESVLSTGFPYTRAVNPDNNLAEAAHLIPMIRDVRRLGCAGLDMAWVASGLLDGYWEQQDGPWDWAAGALLVREAGGRVTTYEGRDWRPGDETLIASNGNVHEQLLEEIQAARRGAALSTAEELYDHS
jgi:myo-inositol-1(or 4)-monophosphatase